MRLVPEHDPVYKVSIIPRGRALGVTMALPEEDRVSYSRKQLESMISSLYGGRLAEELIYGAENVSPGASNDIERATDIARKMVTQWGFSEKLGPQLYAEDEGEVFLGRSVTQTKHVADDTAKLIDQEIRSIIDTKYDRARKILVRRPIERSFKTAILSVNNISVFVYVTVGVIILIKSRRVSIAYRRPHHMSYGFDFRILSFLFYREISI